MSVKIETVESCEKKNGVMVNLEIWTYQTSNRKEVNVWIRFPNDHANKAKAGDLVGMVSPNLRSGRALYHQLAKSHIF